MPYKLNNTATIEFKDGTTSVIQCSYVSYGKNYSGTSDKHASYETVKIHGARGVPTTVINMSEISRLTVTDNPIENLETADTYAETATG